MVSCLTSDFVQTIVNCVSRTPSVAVDVFKKGTHRPALYTRPPARPPAQTYAILQDTGKQRAHEIKYMEKLLQKKRKITSP